jgi:hypothetical protein
MRWFKKKILWSILADTTSALGLFSIFIAVITFFPSLKSFSDFLQQKTCLIILLPISLIYGLIKNKPKNNFDFNINNRDVKLALSIGNIEDIDSAYIVPVNSEFDMKLNGSVQASHSVKAMVINKYFAGDYDTIQKKISQELKSKIYTTQKENGKYKLGTTIRIETDNKKKSFYFVVNSHKLNSSRVEADEHGLFLTLSGLWSYISKNGAKEHIAIPLIGTGNGRLKITRQEVYNEIVRSFVASCASKSYCEKMTIVIRNEDIIKYKINVDTLVEFMKFQTKYVDYIDKNEGPAVGTAVEP